MPFNKISMTGTGIIVMGITGFLGYFNIIPQDGQVLQIVKDFIQIGSWALIIWGQLRRKDLSGGLFRTSVPAPLSVQQ